MTAIRTGRCSRWRGSSVRHAPLLLVLMMGLTAFACAHASDGATAPDKDEDARPGRWLPARADGTFRRPRELTEEQKREIERLSTIGYLGGYNEAPDVTGLTIYDSEKAADGYNFYTSGHFPGAILMDMEGNVLHTWECPFLDAFPGRNDILELDRSNRWRYAHLFPNGDVLGIYEGLGLVKLDKDSNIIWSHLGGEHHDLKVAEDGTIYSLSREAHMIPWLNQTDPILEDFVTVLDADGNMIERFSLLQALRGSRFMNAIKTTSMSRKGDIFHTNALEILDGSHVDRIPAFKKGNLLMSFRELDSIVVVDPKLKEVVWMQFGMWLAQHDPTMLPNGNIMVFDNKGHDDGSKVIEYDPVTQEPVWTYTGSRDFPFFSAAGGANQRLDNGNTLISESDNGRAFEVTRSGEIVWEFRNPARAGENNGLIATIFEMTRVPYEYPLDWLEVE